MPRRTYRYPEGLGFEFWNFLATVGSFLIALSLLVFFWNWWRTARKGKQVGADPWDGRTLEWAIPSPTPEYNFAEIPHVEAEDDFWHRKYGEDEEGHAVKLEATEDVTQDRLSPEEAKGIHLPSPSYYPALAGLGIFAMLMGFVYVPWGAIAVAGGGLVTIWGLFGWSLEPLSKEAH